MQSFSLLALVQWYMTSHIHVQGHMLIPIESWEATHMHVANFTRLSESLGTRLTLVIPIQQTRARKENQALSLVLVAHSRKFWMVKTFV